MPGGSKRYGGGGMNTSRISPGNVALGAGLAAVSLDDAAYMPLDAVVEALKAWAPSALVKSIRLIPSDWLLLRPPLSGRIYARHADDPAHVFLQVSANVSGTERVVAMAEVRLLNESAIIVSDAGSSQLH